MNDYNFGNFVCSLREKRGLTQADIASLIGVTPAAVSKWENGSSKPRVEVLFQLAEILGVRPEELMAGHYIEEKYLDDEALKLINEKYEYLRRIELHNTPKTKAFRLIAWLIDWNVIGLIILLTGSILLTSLKETNLPSDAFHILPILILILSFPVWIVLRDLIFGGRSLGKRIMGLSVLDMQSGETPKKSSLIVRNIFLFIFNIDALIMLITGLTLGDRAAHTVVVRKKELERDSESADIETINRYATEQKSKAVSNNKKIVTGICIAVAVVVLLVCLILISVILLLNKAKETEEYKLAYSYVIESNKFDEMGIEADKLKFTKYSIYSTVNKDGVTQRDAEICFGVNAWHVMTVILHDEGDGWYVCEECTGFE